MQSKKSIRRRRKKQKEELEISQFVSYFTHRFPESILKLFRQYVSDCGTDFDLGATLWLRCCDQKREGFDLKPSIFLDFAQHYMNQILSPECDFKFSIQNAKLVAFLSLQTQEQVDQLLETCFQTSNSYLWSELLGFFSINSKFWLNLKIRSQNTDALNAFCLSICQDPSIWKLKKAQKIDRGFGCLNYRILLEAICETGSLPCLQYLKKHFPLFFQTTQMLEHCYLSHFERNGNRKPGQDCDIFCLEMMKFLEIASRNRNYAIFHYLLTEFTFGFKSESSEQNERIRILAMACQSSEFSLVQCVERQFNFLPLEIQLGGQPLIEIVCGNGNVEILAHIVEKYSLTRNILKFQQHRRYSPLWIAFEEGHLNIIKYFDQKFTLNLPDMDEILHRGFHVACQSSHLEIVKYFCEELKFTARDATRSLEVVWASPLEIVCKAGHLHILEYLHQKLSLHPKNIRKNRNWALRLACETGMLDIVCYLHNEFKLNNTDVRDSANEALHSVCKIGSLELICYLTENWSFTRKDLFEISKDSHLHAFDCACKFMKKQQIEILDYLCYKFHITASDITAMKHSNFCPVSKDYFCKKFHFLPSTLE